MGKFNAGLHSSVWAGTKTGLPVGSQDLLFSGPVSAKILQFLGSVAQKAMYFSGLDPSAVTRAPKCYTLSHNNQAGQFRHSSFANLFFFGVLVLALGSCLYVSARVFHVTWIVFPTLKLPQ